MSQGVLPASLWVFGFLSFVWSLRALPLANSKANRDQARRWLPSLADSITYCSVLAGKVSSITWILEGPLSHHSGVPFPILQGFCAQPALPTGPSALSACQQNSRNTEELLGWLLVTPWEVFWVGSHCLHLLPGLTCQG